jgi:LysR family glycine cleavage system transcriptional activator
MTVTTHLKSLQALELSVREGSLKAAAERLGITPAAVGQRIRSLEDYLGSDLLMRGRSGLQPTRVLEQAIADLRVAFEALDRATDTLDFQRVSEIHIVADPDWVELWLIPRLGEFQKDHPNLNFCINGSGDVPVRLGSPDLRIACDDTDGEILYHDLLVPVTGPDNTRRIADLDPVHQMEGMPLLHLKAQLEFDDHPGWVDWFKKFGHRESGPDRGLNYPNARLALDAVRQNVGFLVCNLSLVLRDFKQDKIVHPFPLSQYILAANPYRMTLRSDVKNRAPVMRFTEWLRVKSRETQAEIDAVKNLP